MMNFQHKQSYHIAAPASAIVLLLTNLFLAQHSTLKKQNASTSDTTFTVIVSRGWNMISLPVIVPDGRPGALFPTATSRAFRFVNGAYAVEDTLRPAIGYWLKFAQVETIAVTGQPFNSSELAAASGWNLVGSVSSPVSVNDVGTYPLGLRNSIFFGYQGNKYYAVTDSLRPGKAYWVKLKQASTLFVPNIIPIPISPGDSATGQATYMTLRWTGASGCTFHVKLGTDSALTAPLILDDSLLTETETRSFCFDYGTTYYWRVGALLSVDGTHEQWSSVQRFTTGVRVDSLVWEFLGYPNRNQEIAHLAVDPHNDSVIYASSWSDFQRGLGRIYKTTNLGAQWDTVVWDVTATDIKINPHNSSNLYATLVSAWGTPPGIIKTTDAGQTWSWSHNGIGVTWEIGVQAIEFDPQHPDTMYASTVDGSCIGSPCGDFYKTINRGVTWTDLGRLGPIHDIAVNPETSAIVFANCRNRHLVRSSDGGLNWFSVLGNDTVWNVNKMAIDPTDPQLVYATVDSVIGGYTGPIHLSISTDAGLSWYRSSAGLSDSIWYVLVRPCQHEVYTYTMWGNSWCRGYRSSDFGVSWQSVGMLPSNTGAADIKISKDGSYVYVAFWDEGLYRAKLISPGIK